MTARTRHHIPAAFCVLVAATIPSCGKLRYGGSLSQDQALAALRAENHSLRDQLAARDRQITELQAKVTGPLDPAALRAIAATASIEVDAFSAVEPGPHDPSVVLYLRTLDGRGRFVQATGSLTVTLECQGGPTTLSTTQVHSFSPQQVQDAYRSSFMGTYYLVRIPFPAPVDKELGLIAKVSFQDAVTGAQLTAQRQLFPRKKATERPGPNGKQGV
ncbi:MAG: hypothetical protein U0637_02280 [Phycisphaerales bacterium]